MSSYGHAVLAALAETGIAPLLLDDATEGRFGVPSSRAGSIARAFRALSPLPRDLVLGEGGGRLYAPDIFRLAQVRFRQTGRLLCLRAEGPPGIMHWTYPIPAWIEGWANIYTVHDVIPLDSPHLSPIDGDQLRRRLEAIAARAARVVAVSDWGRTTIIAALGLPDALVSNAGNGVADMTRGNGRLPGGLLPDRYFIYCGLIEARKNIDRMVAAWTMAGTGLPLVAVGPIDASLRAEIARRGVTILPYQPRATLMDLIAHARALIFPSLDEGFGMPVAEAMTLGTPVLTSDRGALAETAGGAALLVDPESTRSIAEGLRRIADDAALRDDLRLRGFERAQTFSKAAFGLRLTALYEAVAQASPFRDAVGKTRSL